MSDTEATTLELKAHQIAYLDEMAKKYDLPDRSKALRVLITFAIQSSEQETSIFSEIRCSSC